MITIATPVGRIHERDDSLLPVLNGLRLARAGRGIGFAITGKAGMGRTTLLAQASAAGADDGMLVLGACCAPLEQQFAFGAVRQLLAAIPAGRRAGLPTRVSALAQAFLHETELPEVVGPAGVYEAQRALHGIVTELARHQPILLAIDDLQWADDASARFVDYLLRRIGGHSVCVLLTARTSDQELASLSGHPALRNIPLRSLAAPSVEAIVLDHLPTATDAFIGACRVWSDGNPLQLMELLRTVVELEIPPDAAGANQLGSVTAHALRRILVNRLAQLGRPAVAVTRAVAILGDGISITLAGALAGLPREACAEAVTLLENSGLLTCESGLTFTHPELRSATYEATPIALRSHMHLLAAAMLQQLNAPDADVAAHYLRAPATLDGRAVATLRAAAAEALGRGAPESAVALLERALAEPVKPDVRIHVIRDLGMAEAVLRLPAARAHLEATAAATPPGTERTLVNATRAALHAERGEFTAAGALAVACAKDMRETDPDGALTMDALVLAVSTFDPNLPRPARDSLAAIAALRGETRGEQAALAAACIRMVSIGEPATAVSSLLARCNHRAADRLDPTLGPFVAMTRHVKQMLGRLSESIAESTSDLDMARASGSRYLVAESAGRRARAYFESGLLKEAESDARLCLHTARGHVLIAPAAVATLVESLGAQGRNAEARAAADRYSSATPLDTGAQAIALAVLGRLDAAGGAPESALANLLNAGDAFDELGLRTFEIAPWRHDAALVLAKLGRREDAAQMLAPQLAAARRFGGPHGLGSTLAAAALIQREPDIELLREAVAVFADSEFRLKHAQLVVELGAAFRRRGHRTQARTLLDEGRELALRFGAEPLANRAREEILAAGGRPLTRDVTGVGALTPSERRTARLAREGLSNREIAETLFVTPKTIEAHLAAAYRKLDVRGRRDLPDID